MWQIHFYEDHRGKSPVLDFINNLSPKDRAKVNNALRLLEEFGTNLGMPHARRIEGQYNHPGPKHIVAAKGRDEEAFWSLNTDAHLRSVLMGRSQSIPVVDGEMQLGEFGRIYFADFDQVRARQRTVRVQIVGE